MDVTSAKCISGNLGVVVSPMGVHAVCSRGGGGGSSYVSMQISKNHISRSSSAISKLFFVG